MIAAVIVASSVREAEKQMIEASKHTSLVEIRADYIKGIDERKLKTLISCDMGLKKIITLRSAKEGGMFSGNEKERLSLLKKAVEMGADYVDIELSSGKAEELVKAKTAGKARIIVSYHNFKKTDKDDLEYKISRIKASGADIIKIASYANSIDDNRVIFDLIQEHKKDRIIALCMGEKGEISRILGFPLGNFFTFASISAGKESAPGQLTVDSLKDIYRIEGKKKPAIYGLIGNPVKQSKGYILHNKKAKKSIYVNFLVEGAGGLKRFITRFRDMISGLSVTIPFKQDIIGYIDKIDPLAKEIGAVNTIAKEGKSLVGYNTDCIGAIKAIEKKVRIKGKSFLIIGAGGAARAIALGIKKKGGSMIIANRTLSKAKHLADEIGCACTSLNLKYIDVDCIINTTSVGMYPKVGCSPIRKGLIKKGIVVFDAVYNPKMTRLLKDAKAKGCKIITGEEMFINQALEQQKIWGLK